MILYITALNIKEVTLYVDRLFINASIYMERYGKVILCKSEISIQNWIQIIFATCAYDITNHNTPLILQVHSIE